MSPKSPACHAREKLAAWPHLTKVGASCGLGDALLAGGNEIVHLHVRTAIDVHLTRSVISRFTPELRLSPAVRFVDGSGWITVDVESDEDVDQLMTWVSLALHSHAGRQPVPAPCTVQDGLVQRSRARRTVALASVTCAFPLGTQSRPAKKLKRRRYGTEFREGAVRIVLLTGKPAAQVARDLGVHEATLQTWVRLARRATEAGSGSLVESEREELAQLRAKVDEQVKRIDELEVERDVLKRRMALRVR